MTRTILIADDDPYIREMLRETLTAAGYSVVLADSGSAAVDAYVADKPDLILLDLMMPDLSGERALPYFDGTPVIVISAKTDVTDKVELLHGGAVDYVTKPFSPKEIAYRVKASLRRAEYRQTPIRDFSVKIGELMIDTDGCRVVKNGKEIGLTAREFEILRYLAENLGRVISRERLYETIWGEDSFGCDNTMMVHIRHLREKLEENPAAPKYIITMKGLGYKLVNPYEK